MTAKTLETKLANLARLTPGKVVEELDRYIVGQSPAKRAVAVALRNRWRRQNLAPEMRSEVSPKNILMIGPTGVGKTEIARRLAKITGAPFIKVEATKYTEVGYYGRDVESMIRELVENSIAIVRGDQREHIAEEARRRAADRLLDRLLPPPAHFDASPQGEEDTAQYQRTRERMRHMLEAGSLDERTVEIQIESKNMPMMFGGANTEHLDRDLQGMLERMMPKQTTRREMKVAQAREVLFDQECEALLDPDEIHAQAVELAESLGIVFIDEIDKVVAGESRGPDVSRQGVQRDLLPLVEGTTVQTKYGSLRTDSVLFIAAGAFSAHKPSDLMPELQGRFPIRVELSDLTKDDFLRILTEPKNSLTRQYAALLETEGVAVEFTNDAIEALAEYAFQVNRSTVNIGARRLYTILERLLEELSFAAADMGRSKVVINAAYVRQRLDAVAQDEDLSRFIL